jgi:hypothetical protein
MWTPLARCWRQDVTINSATHRGVAGKWRCEWAERAIDEFLRIMPSPHQLADVLAVCRDCV